MISCDKYDYIEIACMHRYPVEITLNTGATLNGTAIDTARNDKRQECIKILTDDLESLIVLDDISLLKICVVNPHFDSVEIN
jgi:Rho-binding antiterminator